jgi:hypothetical protein
MSQQVKFHPVCEIFPPMSADEFDRLKADIKENGQREPITYWDGLLVDGRHRLRACQELEIEPIEDELDPETDPLAWAISRNLHRRHLTKEQREMASAKMANMNRIDNLRQGNKFPDPPNGGSAMTTEQAAALMNVKVRSVERAKHVLENGSKQLSDAVLSGEIKLGLAEKLCKAEPDKREQTKLVKEGKKAVSEFVKSKEPPKKQKKTKDAIAALPPAPDGEEHDFDFPIVNAFSHADYRVNTLKKIVETLTETERILLKEFLG